MFVSCIAGCWFDSWLMIFDFEWLEEGNPRPHEVCRKKTLRGGTNQQATNQPRQASGRAAGRPKSRKASAEGRREHAKRLASGRAAGRPKPAHEQQEAEGQSQRARARTRARAEQHGSRQGPASTASNARRGHAKERDPRKASAKRAKRARRRREGERGTREGAGTRGKQQQQAQATHDGSDRSSQLVVAVARSTTSKGLRYIAPRQRGQTSARSQPCPGRSG